MSATSDKMKGNWNEFRGKIKEKYGELTDSDIDKAEGQTEQLIGKIQQKTGESKEKIKEFIDSL